MSVHYADDQITLHHGDSLEVLRTLPDASVDCCVTAPPYFGLRDYGEAGQYGLESSPAEYVETMRALFSEVRRVLADDGTLWLNLGDSYYSGRGAATGTESVASGVTVEPGKVLTYLGLDPKDPKAQAVVAVAQRYDLDPLLKHVIVIPRGGVYITRDGLLHVAHRSGQLDGIVVEQEPTLSVDGKEWVARVSVWRKDMRHPFTFPGRYSVNGGNREYAQEMALKAAEAHALRRAFDVTGLPTLDEQRPVDEPTASTTAERLRGALNPSPAPDGVVSSESDLGSSSAVPASVTGEVEASAGEGITSSQLKKLGAAMRERGITEREDALAYVESIIGREIASRNDLTKVEASDVIDALETPYGEPVEAEVVEEADQ